MSATEQTALPAKQTTIQALKPSAPQDAPVVRAGFDTLQAFELMQRQAKLLMASTLVPQTYQNNLSNCVIALNMANRIGADPLMVMQNLYVVHGRPGWSAQFVIACFNQCGRFSSMKFRWANRPEKPGEIPDNWSCQAYATELATGELVEGPVVSIAMAKKEGWFQKSGSKWQTIPELMLMYRAGSWLQRTSAPDISMGLRTADEEREIFEARRTGAGSYEVTLDDLRPGVDPNPPPPTTAVVTVDTTTGEVIDDSAQRLPEGFDAAAAEKTLRAAKDVKTLLKEWTAIKKTLGDVEVPLGVSAAYTEMCDHFEAAKAGSKE